MADDDGNFSENGSANSDEDSDYELNSDEDNIQARGNGNGVSCDEEEIDDETLFKSFKALRKIVWSIDGHINPQGIRSHASRPVNNVAPGPPNRDTSVGTSRATSRCNPGYFKEVILSLDPHRRDVVCDHGFSMLLEYDGCSVPRQFVQWIADQTDVNCSDIRVSGKSIPMSPLSIHNVLGTPIGGRDIGMTGESGKTDFLRIMKVPTIPNIKFFGSKILSKQVMSDEDFFRHFMVVALATFLCPNSNTFPSPKYFSPLIDLNSIKEWDWSKFIFEHLLESISKYKNKNIKTLGGCIYFLAVYYLDFLQFGARSQNIPRTIPRIRVWKGRMIKLYSSYDKVSKCVFGKRPIKSIQETCYAFRSLTDTSESFRQALFSRFSYLTDEVIEELSSMYKKFSEQGFEAPEHSPDQLILSMFQYMHDSSVSIASSDVQGPGDGGAPDNHVEVPFNDAANNDVPQDEEVTQKLESDGTPAMSHQNNGATQDTVVIPSNDSGSDCCSSKMRKRKSRQVSLSPEASNSVASRTRRRLAESIGRSPLSCMNNNSAEAINSETSVKQVCDGSAGSEQNPVDVEQVRIVPPRSTKHVTMRDASDGLGGNKEHPVDIEELRIIPPRSPSNRVSIREACDEVLRKHEEYARRKQLEKSNAAEDDEVQQNIPTSEIPISSYCQEKDGENTSEDGAFAEAKKPDAQKAPFFVSPSMPSYRLMEDEDDLGNFISDPKLRRPVGYAVPSSIQNPLQNPQFGHLLRRARLCLKKDTIHGNSTSSARQGNSGNTSAIGSESTSTAQHYTNLSHAKVRETGSSHMDSGPENVRASIMQSFDAQAHDGHGPINKPLSTPPSVIAECVASHRGPTPIAFIDEAGNYHDLSPQGSPEVLVIGERSFKDAHSNLACSSEQIYNMSLSSYDGGYGTQGSSGDKIAIHRPKRIPNPSRYRTLPYLNISSKVLVSHKESDVYNVVLKLADSEYSNDYAIDYKNVRVKFSALGHSLMREGKVVSYVVNALCKKKFKDNHPRDSYKHYYFTKVGDYLINNYSNEQEKNELYENAKYCFKGSGLARLLRTSHLLYFPIHYQNHWFLIVVHIPGRKYVILDSCVAQYGPDSDYHKNLMTIFRSNFYQFWNEYGKLDMGIPHFEVVFADVPQQSNPSDDGVFMMKFLDLWEPMIFLNDKFQQSDIPNIRIKFVNDMLFSEHNLSQAGISLVKHYDTMVSNKYFKDK